MFLRGLMSSMAEYGVPPEILSSLHYYDAIFWVYTHMLVLGVLIGAFGLYVESRKSRHRVSLLLFLAHAVYTCLDFRSSDSVLGNGLYKGPLSLVPAIIGLIVTLLFLHLAICLHGNPDDKR